MILDSKQVFANLLKKYLEHAQKKNSKFSMRALAAKLKLSSAALSELINAKRPISQSKALDIAAKIPFSKLDTITLTKSFEKNKSLNKLKSRSNPRKEILISESEFDIMADWRYFAFMALTRTTDFKSDVSWISKRLGLTKIEVQKIMSRLESLSIISRDQMGNIIDNNACYRTAEDFPKKLLNERQLNGLSTASHLIKKNNQLQAGFFSTITTDTKKLEDASVMIEDFLKKLSLFFCDSEDRKEVFELQIQLFPRTQT